MLKEREKNSNGTATNNTTVAPSSSSTTVSSSSAPLNTDTNLNSNDNNNNSGNNQINNPDKDISNLSPNSQSSSSSVTPNNNNNNSVNVAQLQSNDDQLGNPLSTKDSTNKSDNDASGSDKNVPVNIKKEGTVNSTGGNEPNVDLMHADNPNDEDASNSNNNNNNNGINRVTIKTEEQIDTSSDGFSTNPGGNGSSNQEQHLTNNGNSNNNNSNVNNLGHNIQQNNIINQKQTNGMEYMQQQSQIFVFSTALANKGAESVMNGQFPSIIAYHCSQPATKKFLEKHPLKITQFNRQNQTTQWLNNVTMAKNNKNQNVRLGPNVNNNNGIQNHPNIPPGGGSGGGGGGVLGQNSGLDKQHIMNIPSHGGCISSAQDGNGNIGNGINTSVSNESNSDELPWDPDGENLHLDSISNEMPQNSSGRPNSNNGNNPNSTNMSGDLDIDNLVPEGNNRSGRNSNTTNTSHQSPNYQQSRLMGAISPISGLQPSLQGVKVPDEVLTPQQRQHREESLATIRKMQQMFFPEQGQHGQNPNLPQNQMMANSGILQQQQNALMNQSLGGPNQIKSGGHMSSGPQNRCILPMGQDLIPNQSNEGMNDLNYRAMHPLNTSQQPIDILSHHGSIMRPGNRKNCLEDVNVQMHQMLNQINTCSSVNQNKSQQQQQQQQHMLANSLVGGHGGNNINMNLNSGNNFVSAQIEWNKLQHQFYENKGKMMPDMSPGGPANFSAQNHMINQNRQIPLPIRTNSQGPRSQGPPPPYHQTPRSASVPIATQSPNPSSPNNNPTSNLSLPSPRATGGSGSTLSSPADLSRQQQSFKHLTTGQSPTSQDSPLPHRSHTHSNPSTPLSSHMSPNASLKDFDAVNSQNNNMVKEANLMPVPSPQQIQYLNTFDGQELTIQKQPNTNVKDSQCTSNTGGPTNPSVSQQNAPPERVSGASTPHATNDNRFSSTSSGQSSNQPNSIINNGNSSFPVPSSPQTPTPMNPATTSNLSLDDKNNRINQTSPATTAASSTTCSQNSHQTIRQNSNTSQHNPNSNSNPSGNAAVSPGINFSIAQSTATSVQTQTNVTSQAGPQTGPTGGIKMGNFMDISPNSGGGGGNPNKCGPNQKPPADQNPPSGFNSCGRTDNLPLNPNSGMVGSGPKTSHFDPISSLAQMSQQLTSNSINGQTSGGSGGGAAGVMNYGGHPAMNNDFVGGMIPGPHSHDGGGGGMLTGIDCAIGGLMPGHYGGSNQMISQGPGGSMILPGGPRSVSPKLGGFSGGGGVPRLLGRSQMSGPFNGANIQVKASAPNTIQYLPTRPQISGNQQSRPPSLDFLHRFTNPINNPLDVKLTNPGLQFYANCNQMNIPPGHHMENDSGGPVGLSDHPGLGMGGGNGNLPPHLMGQNIMMRGMRPHNPNQMMRMPGPPGHIISNHFSNSNNNGNVPEQIFSSGGPPNAQMFVAGSKNSPIINNSHGDNSQQIPSTMSGGPNNNAPGGGNGNNGSINTTANQSNNSHVGVCPGGPMGGHNVGGGGPSQQNSNSFKPQFIGPSTADPNYAQQFHNFQQQLYATNTRSQLNQQHQHQQQGGLNPIQSFFVPK